MEDYGECLLFEFGNCGPSGRSKTTQLVQFKDLNRDVPYSISEQDLLAWRVKGVACFYKLTIEINEHRSICPKHRDNYGVYFDPGSKCWHPDHPTGKKNKKMAVKPSSEVLARWISLKYACGFAVGFGLCTKHRNQEEECSKTYRDLIKSGREDEANQLVPGPDSSDDDETYDASEHQPVGNTSLEDLNDVLQGLDTEISPAKFQLKSPLNEVSRTTILTLARKYKQAKQALKRKVFDGLAPGQADLLREQLDSSDSSGEDGEHIPPPELEAIIGTFKYVTNTRIKLQILASTSLENYTKKELQNWFGTTKHMIDSARKLKKSNPSLELQPTGKISRNKLDMRKVEDFLDYLFTSGFIHDVPSATTNLKLDNGQKFTLPMPIRTAIRSYIIKSYNEYCTEVKFTPLSSRMLYNILDMCRCSQRKAMAGLDTFIADGCTGFEGLKAVVERLSIDVQEKAQIICALDENKCYLKGNYHMHCTTDSSCTTHCSTYALSELKEPNWATKCPHSHSITCSSCSKIISTLDSIQSKLQDFTGDEHCKAELEYDFSTNRDFVVEWIRHIIRSYQQNLVKKVTFDNMTESDVVILEDWAMKTLPMYFREKMTQFFGKRGMSMETICAFLKNPEDQNSILKFTFWTVFDQCKQDMAASLSVYENVLKHLKSLFPHLCNVYKRSDNAGCYSGASAIEAQFHITQQVGLHLIRHDFSEPQTGKDQCDRDNASARRLHRTYVNAGNDMKNALQVKKAMEYSSGIPNGKVAVAEIVGEDLEKITIPRISELHSIKYSDNEMTVWKYYNIGKGVTVNYQNPTFKSGLKIVSDFPERLPDVVRSLSASKSKVKLLLCCDESCSKTFTDATELEQHLFIGEHSYPKAETSQDKVKVSFAKRLKMTTLPQHKDGMHSQEDDQHVPDITSSHSAYFLAQGWACRRKAKPVRLTEKQKGFLTSCYQLGEKTGMKLTADAVIQKMREERDEDGKKIFSPKEYIKPEKVVSFFSKLSSSASKNEHNEDVTEHNLKKARSDLCVEVLQKLTANQANGDHSDEEMDNTDPILATASEKPLCIPSSLSIEVECYYAVAYQKRFYIGRVLEKLSHNQYKIKFLHKNGLEKYVWPVRDDMDNVNENAVFYGPVRLAGTGPFTVPDIKIIERAFCKLVA